MQILDNLRPKLDDMASSIQELKASGNDNRRGHGTWGPSRGQVTRPSGQFRGYGILRLSTVVVYHGL